MRGASERLLAVAGTRERDQTVRLSHERVRIQAISPTPRKLDLQGCLSDRVRVITALLKHADNQAVHQAALRPSQLLGDGDV